jgi:hypothetical protein
MTQAQDAARWMWDELQREGILSQPRAAAELASRFGNGMTYTNTKGGVSIAIAVLRNFRHLHGGKARWYPSPDNYWRLEGSAVRGGAN